MLLRQIFDPMLAQYAYLIGCQRTGEALLIDPERDIDRYLELAEREKLRLTAVAETHIHADFLSGARELAQRLDVKLYLSDEGDADWKYEWAAGSDYDVHPLHDGDVFRIGQIDIQALHTPGHTPEHMSFVVTDRGGGANEPIGIATGDFVFVGDLGRPDLLESAAGIAGQRDPSARSLYRSIDRFMDLPDYAQVWPAHGAGSSCGKALGAVPSSTVGYEKLHNASLGAAIGGEEAFVASILSGQPEPPLYFARMKKLNKEGPPVLGSLPVAEALTATQLVEALEDDNTVLVDTRLDRGAFMASHLEGSLYAPYDQNFSSVVGSYVRGNERIVLVIDEDSIDDAIRDLIRIGFDLVGSFVTPSQLEDASLAKRLRTIATIDFDRFDAVRQRPGAQVLDVRGIAEFEAGHVSDAINIAHTRLLPRLDELPADAELLVYCRTGARAAAAAALLSRAGREVTYIDDAFARWHQQ